MTLKETTTFQCGDDLSVTVSGSELRLLHRPGHSSISLSRQEARDLSKALSHAADIVRSRRQPSGSPEHEQS